MKIALVLSGFVGDAGHFNYLKDFGKVDIYSCYWDIKGTLEKFDRNDTVTPTSHYFDMWTTRLFKLNTDQAFTPGPDAKIKVYEDFVKSTRIPPRLWAVGRLASSYVAEKRRCFMNKEAYEMIEDPDSYDLIIMANLGSTLPKITNQFLLAHNNYFSDMTQLAPPYTGKGGQIMTVLKENGLMNTDMVFGPPSSMKMYANLYDDFESISDKLWDRTERQYCSSDVNMLHFINNNLLVVSITDEDISDMDLKYHIHLHMYKSMFEYIKDRFFRMV